MAIETDPNRVADICARDLGSKKAALQYCERLAHMPGGPLSGLYADAAEVLRAKIAKKEEERSTQ